MSRARDANRPHRGDASRKIRYEDTTPEDGAAWDTFRANGYKGALPEGRGPYFKHKYASYLKRVGQMVPLGPVPTITTSTGRVVAAPGAVAAAIALLPASHHALQHGHLKNVVDIAADRSAELDELVALGILFDARLAIKLVPGCSAIKHKKGKQ